MTPKKFIYLISPNKIKNNFYYYLSKIFLTKKVSYFQLRLKKYSKRKKILIGKKIIKICKKNNVKFIINDDPILAKELNADGCHLGQKDMKITYARKLLGNKILGITCHNSLKFAEIAIKNNADYIAMGSFFTSKTKKTKYKATINILNKINKKTKKPIVVIGGINSENYKKLLLNNADYLAISNYIWNNNNLTPIQAIKKLK